MALTLAEAAKLSNDLVLRGVIETVVPDSPILQTLPFIEITGNGLTYNRENAAATAAFFAVGDTWNESTPTFTQIATSLTIVNGDADVDAKSFDGIDKLTTGGQAATMGANGATLALAKLDELIDLVKG